jgi:hypothetical protein
LRYIGKKILVKNANDKFSFAPRDLYTVIFHLSEGMMAHARALEKLDYPRLGGAIKSKVVLELDSVSNRLLAAHPDR